LGADGLGDDGDGLRLAPAAGAKQDQQGQKS